MKPSEWARQREDEGWHVLSVADHFYTDHRPFPHIWVATTAIASATTRVKITTSFVNNLLRSPIEVARQRFFMRSLMADLNLVWALVGLRARSLMRNGISSPRIGLVCIRGNQIVRSLLIEGTCTFSRLLPSE